MANRNWANGGKLYAMKVKPVSLTCNFSVDSTNANGITGLKGGAVQSVTMNAVSTPAGSPAMGTARGFAVLGASAVTNTGNSVLTGNLGISPGTSITGFPPGTFTGSEHIADATAAAAKASAQAAYTDLQARTPTTIATALDAQSLTAGVYKAASGTFTLAQSGGGTLTLTGSATDIFVFQTTTTLTTGAGGVPVITLAGGALAQNVYFVVGSSATINSGSAGTFNGNIIALTSITDTLGGTVNGSMIALNGAVTLSAATISNSQPLSSGSSPAAGTIKIQLVDGYSGMYNIKRAAFQSPTSGTAVKVDNSALTTGAAYIITTAGNSTAAAWHALGVPAGVIPAVGVSFVAASVGAGANTSTSRVMTPSAAGSGISTVEIVGTPNTSVNPDPTANQGFGAQLILQTRDYSGAVTAPADGSVMFLELLLSDSSILIGGE